MQLLWILLTCAVSSLVFMGTERLVSRVQFSRSWRIAFWTLSIVGIGLGIRLVSLRYLKTPTLRLYGFPFPIAGGEFMNGKWLKRPRQGIRSLLLQTLVARLPHVYCFAASRRTGCPPGERTTFRGRFQVGPQRRLWALRVLHSRLGGDLRQSHHPRLASPVRSQARLRSPRPASVRPLWRSPMRWGSCRYHGMGLTCTSPSASIHRRDAGRPPEPATNEWILDTYNLPVTSIVWGKTRVPYHAQFLIVADQIVTNRCRVTVTTISALIPHGREIGIHGGWAVHMKDIPPVLAEETNVLSRIETQLRSIQAGHLEPRLPGYTRHDGISETPPNPGPHWTAR